MRAEGEPCARRVLAVDDCPVQRVLLTLHLEAAGYLVVALESGQEALNAARYGRFDAIILDVNMSGMDGPQIGRALRADPATRNALIVMHSTDSEEAVRERFSAFDAFLAKPASRRQLVERIGEAIVDGSRHRVAAPAAATAA